MLKIGPSQGLSLQDVQKCSLQGGGLKYERENPKHSYAQLHLLPLISPPHSVASFVRMLNSLVHAYMCLYFGLASLGPGMQLCLWWKQRLANLQLVRRARVAPGTLFESWFLFLAATVTWYLTMN